MAWYEQVKPDIPITQGDLIENGLVVGWQPDEIIIENGEKEEDTLQGAVKAQYANLIVMTQACDLEYGKVSNAVLCPYVSLSEYQKDWEVDQKAKKQNLKSQNFLKLCKNIKDGFLWNLAMLNDDKRDGFNLEVMIVDFHEIFTLPVSFLQSLQKERGQSRFRLLPPYREHLSQAFARYFMRVGLPTPINETWNE